MLCERYKEALIEAAAGAALLEDAKRHADDCGACRAEFSEQQTLLTAIDAGLITRSNAAVPAHYGQRLGARIRAESAPGRRELRFELKWVFAPIFAAILCAVLLQHRKAGEVVKFQPDEQPGVTATGKASELPHGPVMRAAHRTRMTTRNQTQSAEAQNVLVMAQENAALATYMNALNARRVQSAMSTELEHQPEMAPDRIDGVEISELTVTPLSDLGAENSRNAERGRNR